MFKGMDEQVLLEQAAECFGMGIFLSCFPLNISIYLVSQSNPDYSLVFKLLTLEVETQGLCAQRRAEEKVLSFKTRSSRNTNI